MVTLPNWTDVVVYSIFDNTVIPCNAIEINFINGNNATIKMELDLTIVDELMTTTTNLFDQSIEHWITVKIQETVLFKGVINNHLPFPGNTTVVFEGIGFKPEELSTQGRNITANVEITEAYEGALNELLDVTTNNGTVEIIISNASPDYRIGQNINMTIYGVNYDVIITEILPLANGQTKIVGSYVEENESRGS